MAAPGFTFAQFEDGDPLWSKLRTSTLTKLSLPSILKLAWTMIWNKSKVGGGWLAWGWDLRVLSRKRVAGAARLHFFPTLSHWNSSRGQPCGSGEENYNWRHTRQAALRTLDSYVGRAG